MNDKQRRKHRMLVRADGFNDQIINDFGADSVGRQFFASLKTTIADAEAHAAAEFSGRSSARHGTGTRADAREALIENLEAISRTARMMADDVPGVLNKFPMPPRDNDSALINAGRAALADAFAFKAQFIARELPADFLEDLNADIEALETAISNQASGVGDHVAAGAALDDALDRGVEIVRNEDVIIKNKYADRPEVLAEWASASHIERAPRRRKPAPSPPPPSTSGPESPSAPPSPTA